MKIAIIGGGMAGLGAAYQLSRSGHEVTIFEKSASLGGLAATVVVGGEALEAFYHHMFPSYLDFFEVAAEMGIRDSIFFRRAKMGVFYNRTVYPFSGPLDLLRFAPVGFFDRLRAGWAIARLKLVRDWRVFENLSARDWLIKKFGARVYQVLWEPLLKSKFGRYAGGISMAWFWSRIYERPARFGYFRGSFAVFTDALAAHLARRGVKIQLLSPVREIKREGGKISLHLPDKQPEIFDKVIVAAPPEPFAALVGSLMPPEYSLSLKELAYVGTICAILVLRRRLSEYYWLNMNDPDIPFVAVVEQTNFVSPETYGGNHVVYLSKYLDAVDPFYRLKDEEVLVAFLPWLKFINPEFREDWILERYVFRAPHTQPVIPVAYQRRRPSFRTPDKDVWWVSMSHIYPWDRGADHSFHAGRELARELIAAQTADAKV